MKRRLVDLIVCPRCGGRFALESHAEEAVPGWTPSRVACSTVCAWRQSTVDRGVSPADCARCYRSDVVEGRLRCTGCRADFPIINGIPRLLSPALLARMRSRYPDFFSRHPEFLAETSSPSDPLAETLDSFTRQRLDLRLPGPELRHQWQANLCRNLGRAATLADLRDKLILDVGCGFGRHLYIASRAGAEAVGIDLSGGVDVARRNNREHARCHIIQADVLEAPVQGGRFDVVWSFGVLHHMPSPRAAFRTIVRFARPSGGLVAIWVYGYRGMALTYRWSHMRSLHRLVRGMSSTARVRVSRAIAAVLSVLYFEPLKVAARLGLRRYLGIVPLGAYVEYGWSARTAAVHDRLSTPITHFHEREELREWFRNGEMTDVCVEDTERRGWRAHAWRRAGCPKAAAAVALGSAPSTCSTVTTAR